MERTGSMAAARLADVTGVPARRLRLDRTHMVGPPRYLALSARTTAGFRVGVVAQGLSSAGVAESPLESVPIAPGLLFRFRLVSVSVAVFAANRGIVGGVERRTTCVSRPAFLLLCFGV
jgi:hypothetical protein